MTIMSGIIKSWEPSANSSLCAFPVNNLPLGVFGVGADTHCCTAIGDFVLDLSALETQGLLPTRGCFDKHSLNHFMELGPDVWLAVRTRLISLLSEGGDDALRTNQSLRDTALKPLDSVTMHMPFEVSEYTDFYAGRHHAENVGTILRGKENALPPNWLHIPIGYNGRASSVVVSGTNIVRPCGQLKAPDDEQPRFDSSQRLDIELEMGAVVGVPSTMGQRLSVAEAYQSIFGYVLLNDWSARDIQAWEYQPLGPFQAKAFATSISPWIVTALALEPFRVATPDREKPLLSYLEAPDPTGYDIDLEVSIIPAGSSTETVIATTNFNEMYYSSAQQLAHHSSSGCPMNVGDLLGSGTISGPKKENRGSLLEQSWAGKEPLVLKCGATRSFLEDGDTITLRGAAKAEDYQIGFGSCIGAITAAV